MSNLYTTFAALYDAAFNWSVAGQVSSLAGLSGLERGRVLEPMCGSGRLLRGFAAAGFDTVGVDASPQMLALAEAHYDRHRLKGQWLTADVTDFDLDEACDLAVCPINSLAHLPDESAMLAHLECMARNLYEGASYWVQLDLRDRPGVGEAEAWEFDYLGESVTAEWACTAGSAGMETHISRFVFPDGRVIEEEYAMKMWSFDGWMKLLARSSFDLMAAYKGERFESLPVDETLNGERIFWQQLVKLGSL
ncbi:MAG: class I SAM-dependent methyltransferase [Pseudomonadales bacterium]